MAKASSVNALVPVEPHAERDTPSMLCFEKYVTQEFSHTFAGTAEDKDTFATFLDYFWRHVKVAELVAEKSMPDYLKKHILAQALRSPASTVVEGLEYCDEMLAKLKLHYLPTAAGAAHDLYQLCMGPEEPLLDFVMPFRHQVTLCRLVGIVLEQGSLVDLFKVAVNDTYSRLGEHEFATLDDIIGRARMNEDNIQRRKRLHGGDSTQAKALNLRGSLVMARNRRDNRWNKVLSFGTLTSDRSRSLQEINSRRFVGT